MHVCSDVEKAYGELLRRLAELSAGAERARVQLSRGAPERFGPEGEEELQRLFGAVALGMNSVLGDVAVRLERLDKILTMYQGGVEAAAGEAPRASVRRTRQAGARRRVRLGRR
jgi:hypothetical protein